MSTSSPVDGAPRRSVFLWWIAIGSLFGFYFIRSLADLVHPDVGWFLWASGRLLDGARLYHDIVDMNPPLIFYFMIPPVWIARLTGLQEVMVFKSFILLTALMSLWICARFIKVLFHSSSIHIQYFIIFVISFLFVSIPGGNYGFVGPSFGQREHIMGMLFMPYALASVCRVSGRPPGLVLAIVVACLAGMALAIKPYFLLGWLALEVALLTRPVRLTTLVRTESIIVVSIIVLYAISVVLFTPEYLDIVRKASRVYGAYDTTWMELLTHRHFILWVVALLMFVFARGMVKHTLLRRTFFLCGTGLLISVFMQRKGWGYHYYPSALFTGAYLGIMVGIAMDYLARNRSSRFLTIERIVGFTIVILIVAASKPMFDSFSKRSHGLEERLIEIARAQGSHQHLLALSTSNLPAFPIVNYSQALWSSRFVELWFLPGLYPGFLAENHSRYRRRSEMDGTERYFFDAVVDDFVKSKPKILINDIGAQRIGFRRSDFDFLAYYGQDSSFAGLFSQYKPMTTVDQYVVYIRQGGSMFALTSTSYNDKTSIPTKHAYRSVVGGKNVSPGFSWTDPPTSTKSFAIIIIDPHPVARNWVHWFVINIPFRERRLVEGASRTNSLPPGTKELMNSFSELGYGGPAPPPGSGQHPYVATIYALNVDSLSLGVDCTLRQFEKTIEGKVIAEATLTGYYERTR